MVQECSALPRGCRPAALPVRHKALLVGIQRCSWLPLRKHWNRDRAVKLKLLPVKFLLSLAEDAS